MISLTREEHDEDERTVLKAGRICMNLYAHSVTVDGKEVRLTLKEYDLLKLMMEHTGKAFSRDELLTKVWGVHGSKTRTVDVHIGTLRAKLGTEAYLIETVRSIGYRLESGR